MKKLIAGAMLAVAMSLGASFLLAPKASPAAAPVPSASQAVLSQWNDIGRKLIAMAEDFPEDKYDFKPTPAQRTFAQQLLHVSNANYYFTNPVMGRKPPGDEEPKREDYKTRASIAAFVKKSFEDGAAAIKFKGDKGLNDLVVDPFATRKPACRIWPGAWSSTQEKSTASSRFTTGYPEWCRRNRGRRSKLYSCES